MESVLVTETTVRRINADYCLLVSCPKSSRSIVVGWATSACPGVDLLTGVESDVVRRLGVQESHRRAFKVLLEEKFDATDCVFEVLGRKDAGAGPYWVAASRPYEYEAALDAMTDGECPWLPATDAE